MIKPIFFDCEFTDLTDSASLISAGFITQSGDQFYAELSDYEEDACNDFVKVTVLPLLSLPPISTANFLSSLIDWLSNLGEDFLFIADSDWDRKILTKTFALAGKSRREFCRQIGLKDAAFQIWIRRGGRPSLARWLAVSYGMDINPVRFLEVDFGSFSETTTLRKLPCALKPRATSPPLTAVRRQAIEAELNAMAEAGHGDISVTMLAERHHLARRHLQAQWPDQCRKISSDYRETTKNRWEEELARKCRVTTEMVDTLLERGLYPGQNIMRDALSRIGISLANPAIRDAYKQQLKTRLGENEAL
jgi:hypothetical protein